MSGTGNRIDLTVNLRLILVLAANVWVVSPLCAGAVPPPAAMPVPPANWPTMAPGPAVHRPAPAIAPEPPADIRADPRVIACFRAALKEPERLAMIVPQVGGDQEMRRTERALWVLFHKAHLTRLHTEGRGDDGRFTRLEAALSEVDLYGLRIAAVTLEMHPVHFLAKALDGEDLRLLGSAHVTMSATVEEADLNAMSRAGRMTLAAGGLTMIGRPDGILGAKTRVVGRIAVTPANQLVLQARSVNYGIVPVPRFIFASKIAAMNPLFDLDAFLGSTKPSFDIRFQSVTHAKGKLTITLTGDLRWPSAQAIAAAKAAASMAGAAAIAGGGPGSAGPAGVAGGHGAGQAFAHGPIVSPAAVRPIASREALQFIPQRDRDAVAGSIAPQPAPPAESGTVPAMAQPSASSAVPPAQGAGHTAPASSTEPRVPAPIAPVASTSPVPSTFGLQAFPAGTAPSASPQAPNPPGSPFRD